MSKSKNILLNSYIVMFGIFMILVPFISNGKDYIVQTSIMFQIIYTLLLIINIVILKIKNNNFFYILSTIILLLAFPLSDNIILYLITLILYLILYIIEKKSILYLMVIIFTIIFILTNQLTNKEINIETDIKFTSIDLGFSKNKSYYAYCIIREIKSSNEKEYSIEIYKKKAIITIFDDFFGEFSQLIESNTCDEKSIQWVNDNSIKIDNQIYSVNYLE